MNATREAEVGSEAAIGADAAESRADLESLFAIHYKWMARLIAKVTRDPARAEELAVEALLRCSLDDKARGECPERMLRRTALRLGIDELRRATRRARYESVVTFLRAAPTPEELTSAEEERERVRIVLGRLRPQQSALLLLRSDGLSYGELAATLGLNPASIGTLLSRAQQAFRKEYIKRYGEK